MRNKIENAILILVVWATIIIPITGYIMNIVEMSHLVHGRLEGMFFVRLAGVLIPPLGVVLGFV